MSLQQRPSNTPPIELSTPKLTRAISDEMRDKLKQKGVTVTDRKDDAQGQQEIKFGNTALLLLTSDVDFPLEEQFVVISSGVTGQDAIVCNPKSTEFNNHYLAFRKTLPKPAPGQPQLTEKQVLDAIHAYASTTLSYSLASQKPWTQCFTGSDNDEKQGVVSFDTNLKNKVGVCRQFAILTGGLIRKVIADVNDQPRLLSPGEVRVVRDIFANNMFERHVVVTYRPHHMTAPLDAYLIDSTHEDIKPQLLRADRNELLKKYNSNFLNNIILRQLGTWCPDPKMVFKVGQTGCTYKAPDDDKLKTFTATQVLSQEPDSSTFCVADGKQTLGLTRFSMKGMNFPFTNTDTAIKEYAARWYEAKLDRSVLGAQITEVGATFCAFAPFKVERPTVAALTSGQVAQATLTSCPELFVLTQPRNGTPFEEFKLTSAEQFFKLAVTTVNELKKIHAKVVLLNMCSKTVLVNNETQVTFDFGSCATQGTQIKRIPLLPAEAMVPEFLGLTEYSNVTSAQDIYCLGRMLRNLSDKNYNLFSNGAVAQLHKLHSAMQDMRPTHRANLNEVFDTFNMLLHVEMIIAQKGNHAKIFLEFLTSYAKKPEKVDCLLTLLPESIRHEIFKNLDIFICLLNLLRFGVHNTLCSKFMEAYAKHLGKFSAKEQTYLLTLILAKAQKPHLKTAGLEFFKILLHHLLSAQERELVEKLPEAMAKDQWCFCKGLMSEVSRLDNLDKANALLTDYQTLIDNQRPWQLGAGKAKFSMLHGIYAFPHRVFNLKLHQKLCLINYFPITSDIAAMTAYTGLAQTRFEIQVTALMMLFCYQSKCCEKKFPDKQAVDEWCFLQACYLKAIEKEKNNDKDLAELFKAYDRYDEKQTPSAHATMSNAGLKALLTIVSAENVTHILNNLEPKNRHMFDKHPVLGPIINLKPVQPNAVPEQKKQAAITTAPAEIQRRPTVTQNKNRLFTLTTPHAPSQTEPRNTATQTPVAAHNQRQRFAPQRRGAPIPIQFRPPFRV